MIKNTQFCDRMVALFIICSWFSTLIILDIIIQQMIREDPILSIASPSCVPSSKNVNDLETPPEVPLTKTRVADLPTTTVKHNDTIMINSEWFNAIVVEEFKFIYFPIPKVASSEWRLLIRRMMGFSERDIQGMCLHFAFT